MKLIEKPVLPKEMFSADENPVLLAQAVRVYRANQRQGTHSALTRAEVSRTRKKYQKQKGTGNARHGDRKAPIFVGGGITFAPKPRDHSLNMSAKTKKMAVFSALSLKFRNGDVSFYSQMADLEKTKDLAKFINCKKALVLTDGFNENVFRAGRNIYGLTILPFNQASVYEILKAEKVLIMEEVTKKKEEEPKKNVTKKAVRKKTK